MTKSAAFLIPSLSELPGALRSLTFEALDLEESVQRRIVLPPRVNGILSVLHQSHERRHTLPHIPTIFLAPILHLGREIDVVDAQAKPKDEHLREDDVQAWA